MRRPTIRDVAQRAGVSKSTVSHVINETRFVEQSTKQRVLDAIEALDYRPSTLARGLVSRRTRTVGLLISDVSNPFYHQAIRGVEDEALTSNYGVFLFNANYDLDRSMTYIHSMVDRMADGVIFMSSALSHDMIDELTSHNIPAVIVDWQRINLSSVGTLSLDFTIGIEQAVHHLLSLGHTRFAHVAGPANLWTARTRQEAFLRALGAAGVPSDRVIIVEGNLQIDGGRQGLRRLVEADLQPTAVFAANDLTALGIIFEARELGLHIPEALSVVGLDDIPLAAHITPSLTTVNLPCYEIGSAAMRMLLKLMRPVSQSSLHQVIPSRLVIRQSTGPAVLVG